MLRSRTVRRALGWTAVAVVVLSVLTWWLTRSTLPRTVRIATAMPGGQYHQLGKLLGDALVAESGCQVELITTNGSVENVERLRKGEAELAIVQAGSASLEGLSVLTPLHHDVVHVVVRRGRGIAHIRDLAGRRVCIGPEGSGMRPAAIALLEHYDLLDRVMPDESYFDDALSRDETLDAAIVTTGLLNPDLEHLLATREFELLSMLDADAMSVHDAFALRFSVPRGLYAEDPPIPAGALPAVATTAVLVARKDASKLLVETALAARFEHGLQAELPTLVDRATAATWDTTPLHPAARGWFDPYGGIGVLASFMESLAAGKELLFALAAGGWLLWSRWRRLQADERERALRVQKERLDGLLDETVGIERAQVGERDPNVLKQHLDRITAIKLKALDELSHEDLRGDRLFLIFLMQCSILTGKIQAKIGQGN